MTTSRPEHTEAEQAAINAALRSGIEQRNSDLVERALKNGADPNILMFAGIARKSTFRERFNAWDRREPCNPGLEWVNLAIAQGADVNAVNPDQRDDKGRPMPAIFCAYDHYKDHGESTEITELLLNNGANVNATNSFGNTSLIYAVSLGGHPKPAIRGHLKTGQRDS
jgi:hypothetical protein